MECVLVMMLTFVIFFFLLLFICRMSPTARLCLAAQISQILQDKFLLVSVLHKPLETQRQVQFYWGSLAADVNAPL